MKVPFQRKLRYAFLRLRIDAYSLVQQSMPAIPIIGRPTASILLELARNEIPDRIKRGVSI